MHALVTDHFPPGAVDRRDPEHHPHRITGRLIACDGARATVCTEADARAAASDVWSVGRLISIGSGASRVVGFVYETVVQEPIWQDDAPNRVNVLVELVGEVVDLPDGGLRFSRGITRYPALGSVAHRIRARDLAAVYELGNRGGTEVGRLMQDDAIAATVCIDDMLSQHFAIVGTTGVGKSSAAALLMRKAVEARPNLRVLLIDPHNEYAHAFAHHALVIDASSFDFPYWMLTFAEFVEVIFRGRPVADEVDALREFVLGAKVRYRDMQAGASVGSVLRRQVEATGALTADTPVPYRLLDLYKIVDEELGKLEPRHTRATLRALLARMEAIATDPRYAFMFGGTTEDSMERVIRQIFRIPHQGRPITVFQLAGIPSEVVNVVASVLARTAFELAMWSRGAYEILFMCEEAHRYVSADERLGFQPTRQAIARIAKEGRKYGASVGIVTQRPAEIDPSILSQCSTVFAMRLVNDRDKEIVRSAVAESSARMVTLLSSIGDREAIAFGQAVATPVRMRFAEQHREELPVAPARRREPASADTAAEELRTMIARMRGSGRNQT